MKSNLEDCVRTTGAAKVGVLDSSQVVDAWRRSPALVNAEPEHFHLVCRLRPQVIRPYVLQVSDDSSGVEDFVLVGRLEKQRCGAKLGYSFPRSTDHCLGGGPRWLDWTTDGITDSGRD